MGFYVPTLSHMQIDHRCGDVCMTQKIFKRYDIQSFFEGAGLTDPRDWPEIASLILKLIETGVSDPSNLETACREFADQEITKGFQTGMLTPSSEMIRAR